MREKLFDKQAILIGSICFLLFFALLVLPTLLKGAGSLAAGAGEVSGGTLDLSLDLFADGLDEPVSIANPGDGDTRLFIVEQKGVIKIVEDDGTPSDGNSMTRMEIDIEPAGEKTRMILTTHFDSLEGMEHAIAIGVEEGMKACMSQIDAVLAEVAA